MKRFFLFAALILMSALPLTAHAADATSFDPTLVKVTAKPISSIPVGTIISWPVAQNPTDWQNPDGSYNWLECNGQNFSQAAYPELFALMGGGRVPDLRGLFLRGYGSQSYAQNNGSTVGYTSTTHSSGALGQVQGDAMREVWGTMGNYPLKAGVKSHLDSSLEQRSGALYREYKWGQSYIDQAGKDVGVSFGFNSSRINPTAQEVRPANVAVRYLIRSKP